MKKINIALLAGGDSSERVISLQSAAQVAQALDGERYSTFMVDVEGSDWRYIDKNKKSWQVDKNDFSLTVDGAKYMLDYALIMIHGTPGEDGKMQGYLDMMGVSYSSCGVTSAVMTFDKAACKRAVAGAGVNLAKEIFVRRGEQVDTAQLVRELGLPMFIKPNASGSSFGVTKVKSEGEIFAAISEALKESDAVLAEEFIDGREMGCGVMITAGGEYILPVTEIISKRDFFDYQAKYEGASQEITPADMDSETLQMLNKMSRDAYLACDCRGLVRIDFIVRKGGVPVMIEINSVPGMSGGSIVPQQIVAAGMTMGEFYDILIADTYVERR